MQLNKVKKSFNDYDLTLSWGQLEAIRNALEHDHADPIADEMLAEFEWYMERVPGPGEEEEDVKTREEMGGVPQGEGEGEEGMPGVEMPPTEGGAADIGQAPSAPPEEMPGGEEQQPPESEMPGEEAVMTGQAAHSAPAPTQQAPTQEPPPSDEADQHLPAPPAE